MQNNKVHAGLRIKTKRLKKSGTDGMLIHPKHLSVRRRDVTGTVLGMVPGHGGNVWFVRHDNSAHVGAYAFNEMEVLPLWYDEISKVGLRAGILSRLKFHGSLMIRNVAEYTGFSVQTIKKHADRLAEEGLATWKHQPPTTEDWVLTRVQPSLQPAS